MSNTQIPDLWPASVKVEILTPYAILRAQATKLTERTQGIVEGKVRSREVAPSLICHTFELLAPVLSFRYTLIAPLAPEDDGLSCTDNGGSKQIAQLEQSRSNHRGQAEPEAFGGGQALGSPFAAIAVRLPCGSGAWSRSEHGRV